MSESEWIAFVGLAVVLVGVLYRMLRFTVERIMYELTANGGNSLKDQVSRIEARLDQLMLEMTKKP